MRIPSIVSLVLAASVTSCSQARPDPVRDIPPSAVVPAAIPAAAQPDKVYRVPLEGLPSIGDEHALVTVVAFTDYQCPYCKRAEATIAELRRSYGNQLRVVVAEAPLPMHERARPAAVMALAAWAQGAYEPVRQRLFEVSLDDGSLAHAASDLGLDPARMASDRAGAEVALSRSQALASRLGVHGTPTFFVNGRRLVGAQPADVFRGVIDERLSAARTLVASGVRPEDVYARAIAGGAERIEEPAGDRGPGCGGDGECDGHDKGDDPPAIGAAVEQVPTAGSPSRGAVRAAITVVEFADYQCPFCVRAESILHAVEQAHPGAVRVVFKDLPLPFHDHARLMARAAYAAGAQGRFWEMHDRLFAMATAERSDLDRVAGDLGLDVARFDRDLDSPAAEAHVASDESDAKTLGVKGTPTFFVNGHRLIGAQPADVFERAVALP